MTEFYHQDVQQTNLTDRSSFSTRSTMPSFQSASKHRTFLSKHLSDSDDDPNSIYKEELIIQIFQHWKLKTLEHQHALNNSQKHTTSNHFSQALLNTVAPTNTLNIEITSKEVLSNNEALNDAETVKPVVTLQKRTKPPSASYTRRKVILKKSYSAPNSGEDPNFLSPNAISKCATPALNARRPPKAGPIFIAPKKTQPSLIPRSYSSFSFNEPAKTKRAVVLERQHTIGDDPTSPPISPTWVPAPPMTPARFFSQSSVSFVDIDDESSGDENEHESLLIRNKRDLKRSSSTKVKHPFSVRFNFTIPTAVFITDPNGCTCEFNLNHDILKGSSDMDSFVDGEPVEINRILSNTHPVLSQTSPSATGENPWTSPILLDKHVLHSIGEEEENDYNAENIRPKEHNRVEGHRQSRHTNTTGETKDKDEDQPKKEPTTLERRWSDGLVDDDEEHLRKPRPLLVKMASATSIIKPPASSPVKISIKKYLLMKLRLTPSSTPDKDDDSNTLLSVATANPPPRKRVVRRSSDKKRYQTR